MTTTKLENKACLEKVSLFFRRLYDILAPKACSNLIFAALFCTLLIKFINSCNMHLVSQYPRWILSDIAVLLGIEIILTTACFYKPKRWVLRTSMAIAVIVLLWSLFNAGWMVRTGTQILPSVFLPLIREPLNILAMVFLNMIKTPLAGIILVGSGTAAVIFSVSIFMNPPIPKYNRKIFKSKLYISCTLFSSLLWPAA